MNRRHRRAQKDPAHFAPDDISTIFAALCTYEYWGPEEVEWPEFTELKNIFCPRPGGQVGFSFSRRHFHILLNATGLFYGFASQGLAQVGNKTGADLTSEMANTAKGLVGKIYDWNKLDKSRLGERLKGCQEMAQRLQEEAAKDLGLRPRESANA